MSSYVSAALRRLVAVRADALCEYCLIHDDDAVFGCEFDHIISEKHGGATDAENLAYACAFCNRAKGSDIGSIVPRTGRFVRIYPTINLWIQMWIVARARNASKHAVMRSQRTTKRRYFF